MMTIQPNIRIHIDSIKIDGDKFVPVTLFSYKLLSVPTRTSNGKSCEYEPGTCPAKRTNDTIRFLGREVFYAPVVRQVNLSPFFIIVARLLSIGNAVFYKKPIIIKRHTAGRNN